MLYSFHKYNPNFDGDVIVVCDDLPEEHRDRLLRLGPVKFESPDPRLRSAVTALCNKEPSLQDIYRRLFSLEVFRLSNYQRVVYLDSDIYCSGDLSELFTATEPLLACPDGFAYGDRLRSLLSDGEDSKPAERYGSRPNDSFNAGVLSIGESLLGDDSYESLLQLLDHSNWKSLGPSKFTDQLALNVYFQGRFTPLHARYNYMIFLEEYQKCLEQVSLLDARLVHFAGAIKPWNRYDPVQLARSAPQFIKFVDVWRELLDEVRNGTEPGTNLAVMKERYQRQKNWIREHNKEGIEPVGRIY